MTQLSPWALFASAELKKDLVPLLYKEASDYSFAVCLTSGSLWTSFQQKGSQKLWFRIAHAPAGDLRLEKLTETESGADFNLTFTEGKMQASVSIITGSRPVLHYTTTLIPNTDIIIPFWPRDILIATGDENPSAKSGKIYAAQEGARSGFLYFSTPPAGTVLYMQNLTNLADYCQQTETSSADTVGGNWPELGFALPPAKLPLKAKRKVVINDAFVTFDPEIPKDNEQIAIQYLELLAHIYLFMPRPETKYVDWPTILDKGLYDLLESPGCWCQVAGHKYFNAYVSDYNTPPEIMVQLAVMLPLIDYSEWSGKQLDVIEIIREALPSFYNKDLGSIVRWLPAAEDELEGEEEQKKPNVMDSWYLHHPLLNLSRLALKGDEKAKELFLSSLKFAIRAARQFNYKWPVFYKMDTLEVIKAETAPGKGGEHDVPGTYIHVLLQAYEITGKTSYLKEAEKAAKELDGLGFNIFYQANNTAFSAGALLRLYKITGKKHYLDLSYTCLAGIFRNTKLWDCNYGNGQHFPSFFALYPLNDAPYTAVYEEQEVFCALHDYLKEANDVELLPAVRLLISEYLRYLVSRAAYYYPPMLPGDMLAEEPKIGEVDPKLWIALEDLQDGWSPSGTVGQEVYGAGNAFGILPRHFIRVHGTEFMICLDYPFTVLTASKKSVSFKVIGDGRLTCRMAIVKTSKTALPAFSVKTANSSTLKGSKLDGHIEYSVTGDDEVTITWGRKS